MKTEAPRNKLIVRQASLDDGDAVKTIVDAAYSMYIERLGMLPNAMRSDYSSLAGSGELYVLCEGGKILGAVLLTKAKDSVMVSNLVVHPDDQGKGYGRELMLFAETLAHELHLDAITLFTNELMHENIRLYLKAGFIETHRKTEGDFNRVYFRKPLAVSR
jgi:N-acetylglutamate synthase-like GNAT family acetyltransferase